MNQDTETRKDVRLQKFIADCGYTSRRKAESLISMGLVEVNGEIITELGSKVIPGKDIVSVEGNFLDQDSVMPIYLVMNKPRGYMTTLYDPEGRKTVMDLCMEISERIYPVGRLDYLSEGLLILTNDGDLANFVMHPKHEISKIYEVKVFGAVDHALLKQLRNGVTIGGTHVKPQSVRIIKQLRNKTWLEFRLGEGKNREIRRICEACSITIDKLKRVAIENLSVDGIAPGKFRLFTKKQLMELMGFDLSGNKLKEVKPYFSAKKSVSLQKKGVQPFATTATEKGFKRLNKTNYYETLSDVAIRKRLEKEMKKKEEFQKKEEAHQKRKRKKQQRSKTKEENQSGPHAMIL